MSSTYHINSKSRRAELCDGLTELCNEEEHYSSLSAAQKSENYMKFGRLDLSKGPVAAISNTGIQILDGEIMERIKKKNLSPTLITNILACPARWIAESFIIKEMIPDDEDNPATRGQLFHKVMEVAFEEDPDVRSRARLDEISAEVVQTDEFKHFKDNEDALVWLSRTIDGYYRMGGRPKRVRVADYQRSGEKESRKGLEVFVRGRLGNCTRDTLGFIDLLAVSAKDPEAVIVQDWKTGKSKKRWNPANKGTEGLSEARQQAIYSLLLEQDGVKVDGARLIYPAAGDLVEVDIKDKRVTDRAIADAELADEKLTSMIEDNLFEFEPPVPLCAWCPLARLCPAAKIGNFAKARTAVANQPSPEDLAPAFDFV